MASERGRQGSTGPRGRAAGAPRRAGRGTGAPGRTSGSSVRPPRLAASVGSVGATATGVPGRSASGAPRPRLTGRAAVLVLVLAVLTVSYASSMRAYLQQRSSINHLETQIDRSTADIGALTRERQQWNDPGYVQQQARLRLGYVLPGEKTYLVLDQNGRPMDAQASLDDPATVRTTQPTAWWTDAWESVQLAGHPPKVTGKAPATRIDGAAASGSDQSGG